MVPVPVPEWKGFCEVVPAPPLCVFPGPWAVARTLCWFCFAESQEWLEETDSEEDSSSDEEGAEGGDKDQEEDSSEDSAEEGAGENPSQM